MEIIPKEIIENPFSLMPGYGQVGQVHDCRDAASVADGEIMEADLAPADHRQAAAVFLDEHGRRVGAKRLARLYPVAAMLTETIRQAVTEGEDTELAEMAMSACQGGETRHCDAAGLAVAPATTTGEDMAPSGFQSAEIVFLDEYRRPIGAKRLAKYPPAVLQAETIREAVTTGGNTAAPREAKMAEYRREATTIYCDKKGKVLTEEEYWESQALADVQASRHNDGDSRHVAVDGAPADPPETETPAPENSVVWL